MSEIVGGFVFRRESAPGHVKITVSTSEWIDAAGNRHIVSAGDGRTARSGYVWQSTTQRDDGLYEHIYRRSDGK